MSGSADIYDLIQPKAFVGMKVDSMDDNVDSYPSGGNIPFGRVCVFDAPGSRIVIVSPAAVLPGPIAGIALHDHVIGSIGAVVGIPALSGWVPGYREYDAVSVLRKGRVWAQVHPALGIAGIIPGARVSFEAITGLVTTGTAGTAAIQNARFRSAPYQVPAIWPSSVLGSALIAEVELDVGQNVDV